MLISKQLRMAAQVDVGFSWESPKGKRRVVKKEIDPKTGKEIFFVQTEDNTRFLEMLSPADLAFDIKRDENDVRNRAKDQAERERKLREQEEAESWLGFTDKLKGATRARVLAVLDKIVGVNKKYEKRGTHIKNLVAHGWRVQPSPYQSVKGRVLMGPNENFLTEKDLTKIGLSFAEYLEKLPPNKLK